MAKQDQIQFRIHVSHKETLKDWATRLGITLTQLYMILAGQATDKELYKLVMTEFACKLLDRIGLPDNALEILEFDKSASRLFFMFLAASAQLEIATIANDFSSVETLEANIATIESSLLRAFGKASKIYHEA